VDYLASGVGVLDKAMFLLNLVEYHQPIGFQALNEAVGYPRTTTHRLVSALEIHGFLSRNEKGLLITGSRFATASLSQIAAPILKQLSADTGESTQLFVRRGLQRLVILSVESTAELRTMVPVGALLTAKKGSAGRLLLGDEDALRAGWVQSVGERAAGIASVSAPVYDGGQVVAAVCLSGPIERLGTSPGATYAEQVMAAAKEIQHAAATSHY
jgi:DNA-binding IclR family transcriptional regulator